MKRVLIFFLATMCLSAKADLPASGPLSFSDLRAEFVGGSAPVAFGDFYRGGANVPDVAKNSSIPTSGQISLSSFYSSGRVFYQGGSGTAANSGSGTSRGYLKSNYGSLSPVLVRAPEQYEITAVVTNTTLSTTLLDISGFSSNPSSGFITSMTLSGSNGAGTGTSGSATYTYSAGTARWEWPSSSVRITGTGSFTLSINAP